MRSFLDVEIVGLRCLNPGCQAKASAGNPITFRRILYDGWTCGVCGEEYSGVFANPDLIPVLTHPDEVLVEEVLLPGSVGYEATKAAKETEEQLAELEQDEAAHLPSVAEMEQDEAEQPKSLDDMNRAELVAEMERLGLKLKDVPVRGKAMTNVDIRAYINICKDLASLGSELDAKRNQEHRTE